MLLLLLPKADGAKEKEKEKEEERGGNCELDGSAVTSHHITVTLL